MSLTVFRISTKHSRFLMEIPYGNSLRTFADEFRDLRGTIAAQFGSRGQFAVGSTFTNPPLVYLLIPIIQ